MGSVDRRTELDELGRVRREVDAGGAAETYRYDAVGNVTEFVNRIGTKTVTDVGARDLPVGGYRGS